MRVLVLAALLGGCDESPAPVCREPASLIAVPREGPQPPPELTALPRMAVGATADVPLFCNTVVGFCGHYCSLAVFDLPLDIDERDGLVSYHGRNEDGALAFRAEKIGSGTIAFVDPRDDSTYGEVAVAVSSLDRVEATRIYSERDEPTDMDIVLATGKGGPHYRVELRDPAGQALVDSSLEMTLPPGAQQVDVYDIGLFGVASGMYTMRFRSSGMELTAPLEIVNEADAIELRDAPATIARNPVTPGQQEYVCFRATSGGRYITGLNWQHVVDGTPADLSYSNACVLAATDRPSGSLVTFTATAGGRSITVQIPAR